LSRTLLALLCLCAAIGLLSGAALASAVPAPAAAPAPACADPHQNACYGFCSKSWQPMFCDRNGCLQKLERCCMRTDCRKHCAVLGYRWTSRWGRPY